MNKVNESSLGNGKITKGRVYLKMSIYFLLLFSILLNSCSGQETNVANQENPKNKKLPQLTAIKPPPKTNPHPKATFSHSPRPSAISCGGFFKTAAETFGSAPMATA